MSLIAFLDKLDSELDTPVHKEAPCTDVSAVPPALRDFYAESNGLRLPFLEIYPVHSIRPEVVPGWCCFGDDGYFSYALCRGPAIDLWDHEGDSDPEGAYSNVLDMIVATYERQVENSERNGSLVVMEVSNRQNLADHVAALKLIDSRGSAQLLAALKSLPLEVNCNRRDGLRVVRALNSLGASSRLRLTPDKSLERTRER